MGWRLLPWTIPGTSFSNRPILRRWRSRATHCVAGPASSTLLFSNDTTHITSCESPWWSPKDGFTHKYPRASIREVAGVDSHLLRPGLDWIPWSSSELDSPLGHYEEFLGSFDITPPLSRVTCSRESPAGRPGFIQLRCAICSFFHPAEAGFIKRNGSCEKSANFYLRNID